MDVALRLSRRKREHDTCDAASNNIMGTAQRGRGEGMHRAGVGRWSAHHEGYVDAKPVVIRDADGEE